MRRILAVSALLALTGLATSAHAADNVYVGGNTGFLYKLDPTTGQATNLGTSCTQIRALAAFGSNLVMADGFGNVLMYDTTLRAVTQWFPIGGDVTALAVDGKIVLVGSADRTIRRLDTTTGQIVGTRTLPGTSDVSAMAVKGSTLYVGGLSTFVYKTGTASGTFTLLTVCGGQVDSMAAANGELILGTIGGTVYRVNDVTGAYYGTFHVAEGQTGVVANAGSLLLSSTSGNVRRVNPITGAVLGTVSIPTDILAMTLVTVPCPADFDGSGTLNVLDFIVFNNAFQAGEMRADLTGEGLLNINDYIAFQQAYSAGCP
ncbi:MAG: PQQ-binding-like beta-propeller repeat protein [Phycisphaerae bacterium]|nr:PQQ-binding-like beta-propeller repeat protein [Phycisphaerae bacterium]